MPQYINKDIVKAEIANLQATTIDRDGNFYTPKAQAEYNILCMLKSFLNALEVKEVDLEEEMNKWRQKHFEGIGYILDGSGEWLERTSQLDIAKHFYELGLKAKGE